MFALEQHIKYLAEVRAGESVTLHSRILARSEKRLHFMHFMVSETHNQLAATVEIIGTHIDRSIRRSAPFAEAVVVMIDERIAADSRLDWDAPHSQPLHV